MLYLLTVNYDSTALIRQLLQSLASVPSGSMTSDNVPSIEWQCVIVNNSPADTAIHTLASPTVEVLEAGTNLGFGGGCNLGLQWVYERDRDAIAWLINPDTRLEPDSMQNALQFCQTHPALSIIGSVIHEPDGNIWFAGGEFVPTTGKIVASQTVPKFETDYVSTDWITGCSLMLNLKTFSICPQFDPAYFLYYEDFDFCRRYANQGHAIALTQHISVVHYPSSITGRNPALKWQHSTYSYLLALERHTSFRVLVYRLGRIVGHAMRSSLGEPEKAIAIIKGVLSYMVRVSHFDKSNHDQSGVSARETHRTGNLRD